MRPSISKNAFIHFLVERYGMPLLNGFCFRFGTFNECEVDRHHREPEAQAVNTQVVGQTSELHVHVLLQCDN